MHASVTTGDGDGSWLVLLSRTKQAEAFSDSAAASGIQEISLYSTIFFGFHCSTAVASTRGHAAAHLVHPVWFVSERKVLIYGFNLQNKRNSMGEITIRSTTARISRLRQRACCSALE
jgi:hypothetical protein